MRFRQAASFLAVVMVLGVGSASAQPALSPQDQEARARFEAGSMAYEQGRYESALNDFRQAYELSHRPALLFNIGTAAQNLRRDREALEAFEQYLRELPDATNRAAVESRIEILRRAVERPEEEEEEEEQHLEETTPTSAPSAGPPIPALALVISGAAVTLVGVALLGAYGADAATVTGATAGTMWSDVQAAYDRTEALSAAGGVLLGVGVAALAVGVILWVITPNQPSSERAALRRPLTWTFDL